MALEVDHVRRSFGSVPAVRDVSFSVTSGTTFGLLGPNGAGKTTTMRMILGILVPDGGSVRWNGAPIDRGSRRRFGYLPEERGLYGKLKVRNRLSTLQGCTVCASPTRPKKPTAGSQTWA